MKKWTKILGGIVVLFVAVVVAGVAILKSLDFNEYKGMIAEQAKAATGRDLKIAGNLNLAISLNPSIAVDGVSFSNAAWGSRPDMVTVKKFAAEVSLIPLLSGQVVVNRLVVEGVDLLAETDKKGLGNWEFPPGEKKEAAAPAGGKAALPSVDKVLMKDVKVTYKDGMTGQEYRVHLSEMTAAAGSVTAPVKMALKGSLNEKPFEVAGTLGSVSQMTDPDTVYPVDLKAKALGVETSFAGKLGTPGGSVNASGALKLAVAWLKATLAEAAALAPALKDVPAIGADKIDLAAKVAFDGKTASAEDMLLTVGKTDLKGSVKAVLGARPNVEATLTSGLVDVDELLPPAKEKAPEPKKADDGRVFPADPLPLDGLKAADAKLAFDAKKIKASGNEVDDVSVRLTLKGGKLDIAPASAVVGGAKMVATVALDGAAATPALKAKVDATGVDYGELLKQRGITDMATGKLDANVDVAGAGGSVRALMAGLNGKVFVKTENGKLNSTALNVVSSDIMSALPGFNSKDDKTIKCGVVNLDIVKGMANVQSLVFETGGLSAIGTGAANLRDETLAIRVEPRAKQTSLASAALVPVDLVGTFAKPDYKIDAASLAANTAGTVVKGAAAIATMGLSLLAESAAKRAVGAVDTTDYCTPALAGQKVVPGKLAEAKEEPKQAPAKQGTQSGTQKAPAQQEQKGGVTEGISKGIKSLFGN